MVAYSFQKRFVGHVLAGLEPGPWLPGMKRHTLRRPRDGRTRHARIGGPVELYTAMRTRHCRLLGRATCCGVLKVRLQWDGGELSLRCLDGELLAGNAPAVAKLYEGAWPALNAYHMDEFARTDGFKDRAEMARFFDPPDGQAAYLDLILIAWAPR